MSTKTVRRSVALPGTLVEQAQAVAPIELKSNLNRLVVTALEQYVAKQTQEAFASAIEAMAQDPAIQRECAAIGGEFAPTEGDGLQ